MENPAAGVTVPVAPARRNHEFFSLPSAVFFSLPSAVLVIAIAAPKPFSVFSEPVILNFRTPDL